MKPNLFIIGKGAYCDHIVKYARKLETFSKIICFEDLTLGRDGITYGDSGDLKINITSENLSEPMRLFLNHYVEGSILLSVDNFIVLPDSVCKLFKDKSANFHPSFLPFYRGVNAISWGLYNEEKYWGITWHRIDRQIDKGSILLQKSIGETKNFNHISLSTACILSAIRSAPEILKILLENNSSSIVEEFEISNPDADRYFSFKENKLLADSANIERLIRSLPVTQYKKWRWRIVLESEILADAIFKTKDQIPSYMENVTSIDIEGQEYFANLI